MQFRFNIGDRKYVWDWDKLRNTEAIAVERETGWSVLEWKRELVRNSSIAITALIWIAQRRDTPELAFEEVDFILSDITFEEVEEAEKDDPEIPKASPSDPS